VNETIDVDKAAKSLDSFLVENQEFEKLNARLSAFNMFDVLKVDRVEIRHSNVLGWLMSPTGSHGLGPVFLRRFLSRLLLENEVPNISLSPSQFELMSFGDVEVLREWQNIDVVVRSAANRWCLLIENKIASKESQGQLLRYIERCRQEMCGWQIIPVLLTLDGDDPSESGLEAGFIPLSHTNVLLLAEQIIVQHRSRIPDDAQVFLQHYLQTLRRLTMQDEELIELCKTIYRKHREAIELIVEFGAASNIQETCLAEITSLTDCEFAVPVRAGVWFLPRSLGDLLPSQQPMAYWNFLPRPAPLCCRFHYAKKKGKLSLLLEVGPIAEAQKRQKVLRAIDKAGIPVRKTGYRDEAKFTRLLNYNQRLTLNEEGDFDMSDEAIRGVVGILWKKFEEPQAKIINALTNFDWS